MKPQQSNRQLKFDCSEEFFGRVKHERLQRQLTIQQVATRAFEFYFAIPETVHRMLDEETNKTGALQVHLKAFLEKHPEPIPTLNLSPEAITRKGDLQAVANYLEQMPPEKVRLVHDSLALDSVYYQTLQKGQMDAPANPSGAGYNDGGHEPAVPPPVVFRAREIRREALKIARERLSQQLETIRSEREMSEHLSRSSNSAVLVRQLKFECSEQFYRQVMDEKLQRGLTVQQLATRALARYFGIPESVHRALDEEVERSKTQLESLIRPIIEQLTWSLRRNRGPKRDVAPEVLAFSRELTAVTHYLEQMPPEKLRLVRESLALDLSYYRTSRKIQTAKRRTHRTSTTE